ncbi:unnamed protein product [Durusdinium trenchii]|uniref:Uncharacterized protein n=2 Tax=Durusdinium trenchii TaxID=1381693 RepID=A0ABP0HN35_9DINO
MEPGPLQWRPGSYTEACPHPVPANLPSSRHHLRDGLQRGLTTFVVLQLVRRWKRRTLRATRPLRRLTRLRAGEGRATKEVLLKNDEDEEASEPLEYLREEDEPEKTDESEREEMALAEAVEVRPVVKKGKERNADLVNPPLPEGIRPYTPGEGYGSNAIPFAGISPKTSMRRNPSNRAKTIEMLKEAKEIADRKSQELAERRSRLPSQRLPVPEHLFSQLEEKGWLEMLESNGLQVERLEMGDSRWVHLQISGEEEKVRAGVLRLMSIMVPPRASA